MDRNTAGFIETPIISPPSLVLKSCDRISSLRPTLRHSLPPAFAMQSISNRISLVTPESSPRELINSVSRSSSKTVLPNNSLEVGRESSIANRTIASKVGLPSFATSCNEISKPPSIPPMPSNGLRLNKFVRRLHDMLQAERESGIVEWRRGLLVLHSTDAFAKTILPKYFNTQNFKTFRRQLNYYGFVHVRSFSTTGSTTTALWVNRDLAKLGSAEISSVLMLKRVEPCEAAKTAEGRRVRKELAIFTVEEDIGVSAKTLQMEQIRSLAMRAGEASTDAATAKQSMFLHSSTQSPAVKLQSQTGSILTHSLSSPSTDVSSFRSKSHDFDYDRSATIDNTSQLEIASQSIAPSTRIPNIETDSESACAANLLLLLSKGTDSPTAKVSFSCVR